MLNLIKADIYRIFSSKTVYVTFICLMIFTALGALEGGVGTVGTFNESLDVLMQQELELSGSLVQLYQMATADNLFYFFLPILVVLISVDFSNGSVKNILARGSSRTKYYIEKLILTTLICSFFVFVYEVFPLVIGTARFGIGDWFEKFNYWKILMTQVPIYWAFMSLGVCIALTVKKTSRLNAIYISMSIVMQLLISVLISFNQRFEKLFDFELSILIRKYAFVENITSENIIFSWMVSICVIIVTTVVGIILFKKTDIK